MSLTDVFTFLFEFRLCWIDVLVVATGAFFAGLGVASRSDTKRLEASMAAIGEAMNEPGNSDKRRAAEVRRQHASPHRYAGPKRLQEGKGQAQ